LRNNKKPKTPKPSPPPSPPKLYPDENENLFDQLDEAMKAKLNLLFGEVEIRRKK
jgi:hypothetical protein